MCLGRHLQARRTASDVQPNPSSTCSGFRKWEQKRACCLVVKRTNQTQLAQRTGLVELLGHSSGHEECQPSKDPMTIDIDRHSGGRIQHADNAGDMSHAENNDRMSIDRPRPAECGYFSSRPRRSNSRSTDEQPQSGDGDSSFRETSSVDTERPVLG